LLPRSTFTGTPGTEEREDSLKKLIDRVVDTVTRSGSAGRLFRSEVEAEDFREELKICCWQRSALLLTSPVWFNIGAPERSQQASALFYPWHRRHHGIYPELGF